MGNPLLEKTICLLDGSLVQQHARLSSHSCLAPHPQGFLLVPSSKKCSTGCVAAAQASVSRYHQGMRLICSRP